MAFENGSRRAEQRHAIPEMQVSLSAKTAKSERTAKVSLDDKRGKVFDLHCFLPSIATCEIFVHRSLEVNFASVVRTRIRLNQLENFHWTAANETDLKLTGLTSRRIAERQSPAPGTGDIEAKVRKETENEANASSVE